VKAHPGRENVGTHLPGSVVGKSIWNGVDLSEDNPARRNAACEAGNRFQPSVAVGIAETGNRSANAQL
jgi:hypothetical protein